MLAQRVKELSTVAIKRDGLNLIEFQILSTLGTFSKRKNPDITIADIAKRSLLPPEIVELYLPKLTTQNLLKFTPTEAADTLTTVNITAEGMVLLERILTAQQENELEPLYKLEPEQRSRLATILRPLLHKLYNK